MRRERHETEILKMLQPGLVHKRHLYGITYPGPRQVSYVIFNYVQKGGSYHICINRLPFQIINNFVTNC